MTSDLKRLRKQLDVHGVLLLTDRDLPSLTTIVAGGPVKGSWWGHPKGNLMYNLSNELMDQPDVLTLKLINKKVTFVQRRYWDSLVSIAAGEADWQMRNLPIAARSLWKTVQTRHEIRADDPEFRKSPKEIGKLALHLEEKLLVYSESLHTDSGRHIRLLRTWKSVLKTKDHRLKRVSYDAAIENFDELRTSLLATSDAKIRFPWGNP